MADIIIAKSAGFCYGVKRAVQMAEDAAVTRQNCCMLGQLIHNANVIGKLEEKGIRRIDNPEQIPENSSVIIRSHGEGKAVYQLIEERNASVIDATCPNVKHIHKIVEDAENRCRQVVIIGAANHPEILAIAGWCRSAVVLQNGEELEKWLSECKDARSLPLTFVSQTTAKREDWDSCMEKAKKECTNIEIFDTICGATRTRQTEALELAAQCDAMIVVGDRKSSNTKKLCELCQTKCAHVQHVETAADIDMSAISRYHTIGITAGASTPTWIIKEVYDKMSEEIMEIEESFAELLEKSIKTLHTGEKVTCHVVSVSSTEVQVDLGTKHAGYISSTELTDDPNAKPEDIVKVGDEIEAYVMRVNDQEGIVTLSKKRLDTVKSWEDVEKACEEKTPVTGVVTEENKGGVVVSVKGVRVFVPASQTGLARDAAMSELLKQQVNLMITEVNRARRRVVGSIRMVKNAERAAASKKVWDEIEVGKKYTGTVKSLTSYGAFVDIGGVDGMVHISELSWNRIKHPSEVVSVGDQVEVYVIAADPEKKKISLGMKDHSQEPWTVFTGKYAVGDVAEVKIVKLMTFGAFAEIVPGVDGLIHISQIADHRIEKPGDVLTEGETVEAKITAIDDEKKKVSLSIRALKETPAEEPAESEE